MRSFRRGALGVAALITLLSLPACGAAGKNEPGGHEGSVRVGALAVPIPRGFNKRVIRGRQDLLGLLVTDYRVKPGSPTLTAGIFPPNRVALSVARGDKLAAPPPLRLPLSVTELGPQRHPDGTAWNGAFAFHGRLYAVSFWVGNGSPREDRAAIRKTLSSIRAEQ